MPFGLQWCQINFFVILLLLSIADALKWVLKRNAMKWMTWCFQQDFENEVVRALSLEVNGSQLNNWCGFKPLSPAGLPVQELAPVAVDPPHHYQHNCPPPLGEVVGYRSQEHSIGPMVGIPPPAGKR